MPGSRDIRAGGAFVEFTLRRKGLEKALRQVAQRIRSFGTQVRQIGAGISAIGGTLTAPFLASVGVFAKVGDSLDKMSKRTGVSAEALSELGFAAEQNGSSLATLERGIKTSQRSITDLGRGLSTQKFAFDQLGLTFDQLAGLSPEKQFTLIGDRISQITDPTKRAAVAMQVFGRAGQELIPLLAGGAQEMQRLRDRAQELGIAFDDEISTNAAELTDSINVLKLQLKAAAVNIGAALAPALIRLADVLSGAGRSVIDWIRQNRELIVTVAAASAGILALGAAFIGIGTTIGLAGFALASIAGLISALISPLGLVVAALAAAGAALIQFTDLGGRAVQFLRDRFGSLVDESERTFNGIRDALEAGNIELAAKILWASLELTFVQGVRAVIEKGIELKAGLLRAITETTIGAIAEGSELLAGLQNIFTKIDSAGKKAWQNVKGDATETFNLVRLQAEKTGNAIKGALNEDFNVEAANRFSEQQFTGRQLDAQGKRRDALKEIEDERKKRLAVIEEDRKARERAIADSLRDELAAIEKGEKAEADRLRTRIADLNKQREALLAQAEAEKSAKRTSSTEAFDPGDFDPGALTAQISRAARTAGVTSSFNIRSIQGGGQDELRRVREVNVQQLKKLGDIDAHILENAGSGIRIT